MVPTRLEYLFNRYINGAITRMELQELTALMKDAANDEALRILVGKAIAAEEGSGLRLPDEAGASILESVFQSEAAVDEVLRKGAVRRLPWRYAAAAALLLTAGGWAYRWWGRRPAVPAQTVAVSKAGSDIAPGGNKAVLVLASGASITLDSVPNGNLAVQGGTRLVKLSDGSLSYRSSARSAPGATLYNFLATPRGGQYQLILPDGTHVWLNAASSIRYPTEFSGTERRVEMSGEAYFEVVKNKSMPFVVHVNQGPDIKVLGTHFDVFAYKDESVVKTTLVEGSVLVTDGRASATLTPGQQAQVMKNGSIQLIREADIRKELAWKNGQFDFDNTDLPTIMRQISRWYDVDLEYEAHYDSSRFGGGLSRRLNLSNVLAMLRNSGVPTKLEGRKITILPSH